VFSAPATLSNVVRESSERSAVRTSRKALSGAWPDLACAQRSFRRPILSSGSRSLAAEAVRDFRSAGSRATR
jgi:hypothetical protein